jgi:hypothetical protein
MGKITAIDPSALSSVTGGLSWSSLLRGIRWGNQNGIPTPAPQNPQPNLSPIKPGMNGLAIRERLGQVP